MADLNSSVNSPSVTSVNGRFPMMMLDDDEDSAGSSRDIPKGGMLYGDYLMVSETKRQIDLISAGDPQTNDQQYF